MKRVIVCFVFLFAFSVGSGISWSDTGKAKGTPIKKPAKMIDEKSCFNGCHDTVEMLYGRGVHKNVNCGMCHEVKPEHITEPSEKNRPLVRTDHGSCGACHDKEHSSMLDTQYHMDWASKNNVQSYSMVPNGESGIAQQVQVRLPRYHVGMLADIAVNRSAGRFKYINQYDAGRPVEKLWDKIYDAYPDDGNEIIPRERTFPWRAHKSVGVFRSATCIKCKSTDNMLDYAYKGEPGKGAPLDLSSPNMPMFKSINYATNCNFCHDPHSAEPRVVNDMLIDAFENPLYKTNIYQSNPSATKAEVLEMGERGYTRKIAILEKYDSNLMCGQCHSAADSVAGFKDLSKGKSFDNAEYVSSYAPALREGPIETFAYYKNKEWYNMVHPVTGTLWMSFSDPFAEINIGSTHGKAGVGCTDCHYAKETVKNKSYMNHQVSLPKEKTAQTCLRSDCHGKGTKADWKSEAEALYTIDMIQQKGRVRLAELNNTVNNAVSFINDVNKGVFAVETKALDNLHNALSQALTVDGYWYGEFSTGFHNPELFESSITKVIADLKDAQAEATKKVSKKK